MMEASFYDLQTGLFVGRTIVSSHHDDIPAEMIPEGTGYVAGRHDPLLKRLDLTTKEVVDYTPPRPSPDHVWNGRRWQLSAEAQTRADASAAAIAEIRSLEASQGRALREAVLGEPGGRDRLLAIQARIAELRPSVMANCV